MGRTGSKRNSFMLWIEQFCGTGAAEVAELQPHAGLFRPVFDEQVLEHLARPLDLLRLFQPAPRLDQLPVVGGDEKHLVRLRVEKRVAELLEKLLVAGSLLWAGATAERVFYLAHTQ